MANWYVSTTGNDTTGDGSYSNPYKHIHKAIDVCADGDEIKLFNGTYDEEEGRQFEKSITISSISELFYAVTVKPKTLIGGYTVITWLYSYKAFPSSGAPITVKFENVTIDFDRNNITSGISTTDQVHCVYDTYYQSTVAPSVFVSVGCAFLSSNWTGGYNSKSAGFYQSYYNWIYRFYKSTFTSFTDTCARLEWGAVYDIQDSVIVNNGYGMYLNSTAGTSNIENNNCFYGNTHDIYRAGTGDITLNATDITVDPLFESATDLRLTESSPCIDAGVIIPGYVETYKGTAPDMGCDEFGPETVSLIDTGAGTESLSVLKDHSPATWDIDKYYFDGLGGDATFDGADGHILTTDFSFSALDQYVAQIAYEFEVSTSWDLIVRYAKYLDLLKLVPEKFHSSEMLVQYLKDVGIYGGTWLSAIDDIEDLLDPYSVDEDYIDKLAGLIGLTLVRDSETTLQNLRNQIAQACDWYKIKGTYGALEMIAYLSGLTISIYDMYTEDYVTFVKVPWFVGDEGENPEELRSLSSSYYKSPHFTLEILLNRVYESTTSSYIDGYLWKEDPLFTNLSQQIETIRPVNTVPHYELVLRPDTNETGEVVEVDGDINTKVMGSWVFSRRYFDSSLNFDESDFFDWSYDSFLASITVWKLGDGNKGITPGDSSFTGLENVVLTGTIDSYTVYSDRVEFEFEVGTAVAQDSLSELGLYLSDGTTLVLASTFPDINKHTGAVLKVRVRVYK